jgi:hypothetical protein
METSGQSVKHTPEFVSALFDQELDRIVGELPAQSAESVIEKYREARRISMRCLICVSLRDVCGTVFYHALLFKTGDFEAYFFVPEASQRLRSVMTNYLRAKIPCQRSAKRPVKRVVRFFSAETNHCD